MHYRFFSLLLLLGILGVDDGSVPSLVLVSSSSHLLEVPSFGFYGSAQCDKDGNLFFHSSSASYSQATVLRLNSGTWEPTVFKVSPDFLKDAFFEEFSVTPSGQVWLIGAAKGGGQYVYAFSSDGEMSSRTKLEVQNHLNIQDFAVSDRGTALIAGYFDSDADDELKGKPFIGLFDRSGRLLKLLNEPFETVDIAAESLNIHAGNATFGDDGLFYLLHAQSVVVLSESGAVVRRIKFDKADKDSRPTKVAISGGIAAIWLIKVDKKGMITQQFLVLNAETGEGLAFYTPSGGINENTALCFSRKDGFEFFGIESGRVRLSQAALR